MSRSRLMLKRKSLKEIQFKWGVLKRDFEIQLQEWVCRQVCEYTVESKTDSRYPPLFCWESSPCETESIDKSMLSSKAMKVTTVLSQNRKCMQSVKNNWPRPIFLPNPKSGNMLICFVLLLHKPRMSRLVNTTSSFKTVVLLNPRALFRVCHKLFLQQKKKN